MKYIKEFYNKSLSDNISDAIHKEVIGEKKYYFMEFCGGHTHVIFRSGIMDLLPKNIIMVHGPGCPVCVLPTGKIDSAIYLAQNNSDVILCVYGDLMRVPGSNGLSLLQAKATGAKVRIVYSPYDAVKIAANNPDQQIVFFGIGFETTAPATALAIKSAKQQKLNNFTVFCNHVLTPPAVQCIADSPEYEETKQIKLDGFIGPGHVSSVIGYKPYQPFADKYKKPIVIAGFQPLDLLQALLMLIVQVNKGTYKVENQYVRVVTEEGNTKAQHVIKDVFERRDSFEWRGLGSLPLSAFQINKDYALFDAEKRFDIVYKKVQDHPSCACAKVLKGMISPLECKIFGKVCTPENPVGSCMVSSEGACAAYYNYGWSGK